jgi:peptidoglycan/LPS O-acetylase OafA/YrhL
MISYLTGVMVALGVTRFLRRPLKSLTWLGAISYSIYLVHPFFLEWAAHTVSLGARFDPGVFALYILATLALSSLSYRLIEKPSVGLGRALSSRLRGDIGQKLTQDAPSYK